MTAKKIFNVGIYVALLWSIFSAVYISLPIEYQAMLPNMNEGTAIISGITTFFTGTGGLAVQHYLLKTKSYNEDLNKTLVEKVMLIIDAYKEVKETNQKLIEETELNNKLLKISLKAKLDNPTLTNTSRSAIEGAISEDEK